MICVYDPDEREFKNNGIAVLNPITCTVTEELNGTYELDMLHPVDAHGKWTHLGAFNIIRAPVPGMGYQPFRICRPGKIMGKGIKINARHVFYDLLYDYIHDCGPVSVSPKEALSLMFESSVNKMSFAYESDITQTAGASFKNINPVNAIMGDESCLLNLYRAEIIRDGFGISINKIIGRDSGVRIAYGKNLLGIEYTEDVSNTVTRLIPHSGDTYLPELYIDSPHVTRYPFPLAGAAEFTGLEGDIETGLRNGAEQMFADGCDLPDINVKIDFTVLEKTEEYKNYRRLEAVNLGDFVSVAYPELGLDLKARCVKYEYDCITERYNMLELGTVKESLSRAGIATAGAIDRSIRAISGVGAAAQVLSDGMGGNVLKRYGELLIMDTDDIATAKKIWKWDKNGLSYSENGYGGQWRIKLGMDGKDAELNAL